MKKPNRLVDSEDFFLGDDEYERPETGVAGDLGCMYFGGGIWSDDESDSEVENDVMLEHDDFGS